MLLRSLKKEYDILRRINIVFKRDRKLHHIKE